MGDRPEIFRRLYTPPARRRAITGAVISFWLLSLAMRTIAAGTAYAVWTGIGIVGVALYGLRFWNEPACTLRLLFLLMITGGIVGLKVAG